MGNDDGAMNIHVETAIEAGDEDLIYDRAPDTGFISINCPIRGDLNNDGKTTPADAAIALRIAIGSSPYDGAADVNNDHKVTSLDALMILQTAAGAISL